MWGLEMQKLHCLSDVIIEFVAIIISCRGLAIWLWSDQKGTVALSTDVILSSSTPPSSPVAGQLGMSLLMVYSLPASDCLNECICTRVKQHPVVMMLKDHHLGLRRQHVPVASHFCQRRQAVRLVNSIRVTSSRQLEGFFCLFMACSQRWLQGG